MKSDHLIRASVWMNLENITLSDKSQSGRTTYYVIPFMKIQHKQIFRDRRQIGGCRGLETDCLMGTEFPIGVLKMFWNQAEGVVAQHCECTKCPWVVLCKMVRCLLYELDLNLKCLWLNRLFPFHSAGSPSFYRVSREAVWAHKSRNAVTALTELRVWVRGVCMCKSKVPK